jgi:hypothetical protein
MKSTLSRSIASYKRTPKLGKGDKLTNKKRTSNVLGLLATPNGYKKIMKSPLKKPSLKIMSRTKRVRIWKVTDTHHLYEPANYQYMNPASYGHGVNDVDSTISYSSSENWYKRRAKYSKSSNRSSARGNSAQWESADDGFIRDILWKNEDIENHSTNIAHDKMVNLLELISSKRIEQSISKFSSHLNLTEPLNMEEVPENKNLLELESEQNQKFDHDWIKPESFERAKGKRGANGKFPHFVEMHLS